MESDSDSESDSDCVNDLMLLAVSERPSESVSAIILDLAMPEFSGYDIINELEKNGKIKEQCIIVLTASAITTEQINSLQTQGVKSCLKKPVTPDVLLKVISSFH